MKYRGKDENTITSFFAIHDSYNFFRNYFSISYFIKSSKRDANSSAGVRFIQANCLKHMRNLCFLKGFDSQYNEHTIRYLSSVKLMTDAYDYFWKLKNRFAPFETVPKEMLPFCREADDVFTGMYSEFMLNKDLYFVNKKSLTKEGGRRIRYYASFYPSFQKIEPVDSLLSSIPLSIERRGMTPRLLLLNCDEHPYMSMLK